MNFRTSNWFIFSLSLFLSARDATTDECYVNHSDRGEGKLTCFNLKDGAAYNETFITNLTQILLFRTELSNINSNFFEKFSSNDKITTLSLSYCNLTQLNENAFGAFRELLHLNLSFNRIGNVSEEAFATNVKLKSISLMANEIKQLKRNTFSALVDLESVDLTRNHIDVLDRHIFLGNANLVNLDVKFNRLKEISGVMFHGMPALESLDLSRNRIESIPPHVFKYNYALTRLNLQGNRIKNLDFAFVHLGLTELNLLENPLDMDNEKNRRVIKHLKMSNLILKVADHAYYKEDVEMEERKTIPGEVVFKTSPQMRLLLTGIITSLIIIMILLCFLSYHVYQRSKQKLQERYYGNSCRSIDCLQSEEQRCLSLSISEGNAFFRNCGAGMIHTNEYECSCDSCFKQNVNTNS